MYDDGSVYMPLIHLTTHTFLSTLESTMDCWTGGRTDMFVCISLFIAVVSCSDGNTNGSQKVFHFGLFFHTRWLRTTMTLLLVPARRKWPMVDGDDDGNVAVAIADVPV